MNNPLVSVIIPCYNVEHYIENCIASVVSQDYKNIEIICVDDGSTDSTLLKLKKLLNSYNILIYEQENRGAPAARNTGLSFSKGEFIQFLDADDFLAKRKISNQMALINSQKEMVDIVVGNSIRTTNNGKVLLKSICENHWLALIKGKLGNTCANLFRKETVIKAGSWNESQKSSQEYELMFRILKAEPNIIYDPEYLTYVSERKEKSSISQKNKKENWMRIIALRLEIKEYLKEINYNKEIISAGEQEIFNGIRALAKYDISKATELHSKLIKGRFKPYKDNANSRLFLWLYRIFGFRNTERIKRFYKGK